MSPSSSSRNTPGSSASVNFNGGGQVNHVNAAENQDNAPNNAANNAPHKAGSSAQPVVPSPEAAAASSGGGLRELRELASSTYSIISSVSDTVASNMSIGDVVNSKRPLLIIPKV